jgi:hypothetical protein
LKVLKNPQNQSFFDSEFYFYFLKERKKGNQRILTKKIKEPQNAGTYLFLFFQKEEISQSLGDQCRNVEQLRES